MQFRRAGDYHPAMPHLTAYDLDAEWLEADGSGGFASGTVGGPRTRRYHGLLSPATTPPTGRMVLVNGVEAWLDLPGGAAPLSTQAYAPNVVFPDARGGLVGFDRLPWPTWIFALGDGTIVVHEIFVQPASCETVMRWRRTAGSGACRLRVRPLLSGRDYHALHRENGAFDFAAAVSGGNVCWRPYPDVPAVTAMTNGSYEHQPVWYRNFMYAAERERGLDFIEDLGSPGEFAFDLSEGDTATIVWRTGDGLAGEAGPYGRGLAASERARRSACGSGTQLAAKSYLVTRGTGRTLIAGFPWFTDWGRDTFIAMRGLVLGEGCLSAAEDILRAWSGCVSEGMLPNRFPDVGGAAEYNAVDASLWYVVAVHEFLVRSEVAGAVVRPAVADSLRTACEAILAGYSAGTRFGIAAAPDGLLRAGVDGVQLTWMDAKTGGHVVTPRIGKPVEIQALWINALRIGGLRWNNRWRVAGGPGARFVFRKVLEPGRRIAGRGGCGACGWRARRERAAEPDLCGGRAAVCAAGGRARAGRGGHGGAQVAHTVGAADAVAPGSRVCGAV